MTPVITSIAGMSANRPSRNTRQLFKVSPTCQAACCKHYPTRSIEMDNPDPALLSGKIGAAVVAFIRITTWSMAFKKPDQFRQYLGPPLATMKQRKVSALRHKQPAPGTLRDQRAQPMSCGRLTRRGDVIILTLDCHQGDGRDAAGVNSLAMPGQRSATNIAAVKHCGDIVEEELAWQVHNRRKQREEGMTNRVQTIVTVYFVRKFALLHEMPVEICHQRCKLQVTRID